LTVKNFPPSLLKFFDETGKGSRIFPKIYEDNSIVSTKERMLTVTICSIVQKSKTVIKRYDSIL